MRFYFFKFKLPSIKFFHEEEPVSTEEFFKFEEKNPDWNIDSRVNGAMRRLGNTLTSESYFSAVAVYGSEVVDFAFFKKHNFNPSCISDLIKLKRGK